MGHRRFRRPLPLDHRRSSIVGRRSDIGIPLYGSSLGTRGSSLGVLKTQYAYLLTILTYYTYLPYLLTLLTLQVPFPGFDPSRSGREKRNRQPLTELPGLRDDRSLTGFVVRRPSLGISSLVVRRSWLVARNLKTPYGYVLTILTYLLTCYTYCPYLPYRYRSQDVIPSRSGREKRNR